MANGIIAQLISFLNTPIRIRSSEEGKAIYFADAKQENICEDKEYYNMGALGPYTADLQHKFKLQYGNWRIFEVRDKDEFFSTMLTSTRMMIMNFAWEDQVTGGKK